MKKVVEFSLDSRSASDPKVHLIGQRLKINSQGEVFLIRYSWGDHFSYTPEQEQEFFIGEESAQTILKEIEDYYLQHNISPFFTSWEAELLYDDGEVCSFYDILGLNDADELLRISNMIRAAVNDDTIYGFFPL